MDSSAGASMALEKELATYKAKLHEMKEHEGKYVLIHGSDVIDYFGTYEDAIKEGYAKFKLEPFLVKQIQSVEQVHFISRLLDPCHI
jgi:predicted secreted acid phosphatase